MLEAAIEGSFQQHEFDETRLSALESKMDDFLSSSALSARNLQEEKQKIEELITDISHQVKTPIATIMLYSQLMEEQALPPETEKCVRSIGFQGEKLNFLMASLIKLSRLEAGVFTLHPVSVPLQPMLDEIEGRFKDVALKRKITLHFENTHVSALYDPKWTAEALFNLVDNALKYTPREGSVRVSTTVYDIFCRIDIQDTGSGIALEEQAKVFSRFYRSPSVSMQEGIGIGLYLAREIVSQQGGYIRLESALGKGSLFSVFLPLSA